MHRWRVAELSALKAVQLTEVLTAYQTASSELIGQNWLSVSCSPEVITFRSASFNLMCPSESQVVEWSIR